MQPLKCLPHLEQVMRYYKVCALAGNAGLAGVFSSGEVAGEFATSV